VAYPADENTWSSGPFRTFSSFLRRSQIEQMLQRFTSLLMYGNRLLTRTLERIADDLETNAAFTTLCSPRLILTGMYSANWLARFRARQADNYLRILEGPGACFVSNFPCPPAETGDNLSFALYLIKEWTASM